MNPDPGQYDGMHAVSAFPHHGKGPFFDRPAVEPLFGSHSGDRLADIVATFLGPERPRAAGGPPKSPQRGPRGNVAAGAPPARTMQQGSLPDGAPSGVMCRLSCSRVWCSREECVNVTAPLPPRPKHACLALGALTGTPCLNTVAACPTVRASLA